MPFKLAVNAREVHEQDSSLPSELVSSITASVFHAATPPVTPAIQNGAVIRVDVNGKSPEAVKARNFSPDLGHGGGNAAAMNGGVRAAGGSRSKHVSNANSLASSPFLSADGSELTSPAASPVEPIASKVSPIQVSQFHAGKKNIDCADRQDALSGLGDNMQTDGVLCIYS